MFQHQEGREGLWERGGREAPGGLFIGRVVLAKRRARTSQREE